MASPATEPGHVSLQFQLYMYQSKKFTSVIGSAAVMPLDERVLANTSTNMNVTNPPEPGGVNISYDGDGLITFCLDATDHMQNSISTIVLGLLIAFAAPAVRAQPKAPEAQLPINALPAPPSTPLDLSLHPAATPQLAPVDLTFQSASEEVKRVSRWVIESRDNAGLPYLLIDKVNAQVFAFDPAGRLQGAAPVLLGMARGDRMLAPNDAKMSQMAPEVRITPAGRFVSRLAKDSTGKELLVLDYDASLSLHPVVKGTPAERRAERLKSATAQDNRISFGCINAPTEFYARVVSPAFSGTKGIVYVLPETGQASALFGFQPVDAVVVGAQHGSTASDAPSAQPVPAPVAR